MYRFLSATIIIHTCIVSALTAFPMPRLFPLGRMPYIRPSVPTWA